MTASQFPYGPPRVRNRYQPTRTDDGTTVIDLRGTAVSSGPLRPNDPPILLHGCEDCGRWLARPELHECEAS